MLNKQERYKVLEFIRICCKLGLLPLQVDLASWQLKEPSSSKQWIGCVSYFCFVLHAMYKSGTLVYTYLFVPEAQLHQLVIHVMVVMASIMTVYWYYVLYVRSPKLFATFVKLTLLGNVGGPDLGPSDELETHWRTRLREYSLQDLVATNVPFMVGVSAIFVLATFVYDSSMRFLLYAALPSGLQNWATFGLCLLEEIRLVVIEVTTLGPIWQLQVVSFDLISNKLKLLIRTIENGTQNRRAVYTFLRCLQLYLSIINKINSYLVFTWKLVCISMCIISGYAAIAHFQEHPVFGIMYYVVMFNAALIYSVIYERDFMIPQLLGQAVGCAKVHMDGNRAGLFGRQMRSIPPTGIKVGNFHRMERASTLIFMNFVVVNIVNMLVAYG